MSTETPRFIVATPAAPGSKGDEGMLCGMLKVLGDRNIIVLNPDPSPLWSTAISASMQDGSPFAEVAGPFQAFYERLRPTDTLLVLGADVVDGTCGLEPSLARLGLVSAALHVGSRVLVFCSFRSDVSPEIIGKLGAAGEAHYFMRDPLSLENFRRQTRLEARAFVDFFMFCDAVVSQRVLGYKYFFASLRAMGKAIVGVNFCEHAFRSFYDDHTASNRLAYVSDALSTLTVAMPSPYFVLISNDSRRWPNFQSDSDYQELAHTWLVNNGYGNDVLLLEPEIAYPEILSVLGDLNLAVTGRMHLALAAFRAGVVPVVLMGQGKGYSSVDKMRGAFTKYLGRADLVASNLAQLRASVETVNSESSSLRETLRETYRAIMNEAHADLKGLLRLLKEPRCSRHGPDSQAVGMAPDESGIWAKHVPEAAADIYTTQTSTST